MKEISAIRIDMKSGVVQVERGDEHETLDLQSPAAFEAVSRAWLRAGWDAKYVYAFTWMGRPIIQLPDDLLRIQEVIYRIKPDVILETGIAHGGSLVFYASLCKAIGKGRVIGVDVELRPHNRAAIQAHELFEYITLVDGNSVAPEVVDAIDSLIKPGERVLAVLDSKHTREHVLAELRAYARHVSVGSYIIACDGIMGHVPNAPYTQPDWSWNNPEAAARAFVEENRDFVIEEPAFPFNEGMVSGRVTYWPGGFLKRVR